MSEANIRFQVPQFLETETKLIGPFTLLQFLWLAGGAVLIFLLNFILPGFYFIVSAVIVGAIALAFAYFKIEGMPLVTYLLTMLSFTLGSKKYFFRKEVGSGEWIVNSDKNKND